MLQHLHFELALSNVKRTSKTILTIFYLYSLRITLNSNFKNPQDERKRVGGEKVFYFSIFSGTSSWF
jgi:hypothetical protein